jgi:putative ABC transport system permease protein
VAVSAVLLVVAGLLIASLYRVLTVDKGFNTESALSVEVELRKAAPEPERERLVNAMVQRAATLPGVVTAAATTVLPLEGTAHVNYARREGDTRGIFELPLANYRYVTPSYAAALQIPLKRGRWFTPEDRNRQVVVISENLASLLWPGEDPLGKRLEYNKRTGMSEVIGVVADARAIKLDRDPMAMAYVPIWNRNPSSFALVVRTTSDPAALASAVRSEVFAVDSQAVVARIRTLDQVLADSLAARRFQLLLIGVFAGTALVLASLGIYGVVAYSIARRKTEIGIRIALGAALADVHRLVLRQGMRPVVLGLVAGVAGALAAGRLVESLLFGTHSTDPLTFSVVVAVLFGAGLLACYLPARRATRMDPASALRHE